MKQKCIKYVVYDTLYIFIRNYLQIIAFYLDYLPTLKIKNISPYRVLIVWHKHKLIEQVELSPTIRKF